MARHPLKAIVVGERFARLGEPVRIPPSATRSGEEILGVELEALAGQLDHEWLARNSDSWNRHRAEFLDRRTTLD